MKWGIRRYQNKDGTLTAAGRKRYLKQDGSLSKKGVEKAKKDYSREWEQPNNRYEKRLITENDELLEYTKDTLLGAVVDLRQIQAYEDWRDRSKNLLKDDDIRSGKRYLDILDAKQGFNGSIDDFIYETTYKKANADDRRFLKENEFVAKYWWSDSYPREQAYLFADFQHKIDNKTVNVYESKPKTAQAKIIYKKMDDAYERWRHLEDGRIHPFRNSDNEKAYNDYLKYKNQLIDLAIKDQGYVPSKITRKIFEGAMFWD
jgi:hypothetical protein